MPLFAVIAFRDPDLVRAKVRQVLPGGRSYEIAPNAWMADFTGTTHELAEAVGIRSGDNASTGVTLMVSNYSGRANPDLWEWIKLHWTSTT